MKCKHIKKNNKQCNANAMKESDYCYLHNPEIPDEIKLAVQKSGGANRGFFNKNPLKPLEICNVEQVTLLLVDTINRVRSGDMDIRIANSLGFLSGHLLRSIEQSTIEKRVQKIEEVLIKKYYKPTIEQTIN